MVEENGVIRINSNSFESVTVEVEGQWVAAGRWHPMLGVGELVISSRVDIKWVRLKIVLAYEDVAAPRFAAEFFSEKIAKTFAKRPHPIHEVLGLRCICSQSQNIQHCSGNRKGCTSCPAGWGNAC